MSEPMGAVSDVESTSEKATSPGGATIGAVVVIGAALAAEVGLLIAALRHTASTQQVFATHLAVVAVMIVLLYRRLWNGGDGGFSLLAVVGTFATGPFGAAGVLLMPWLTRQNATSDALLTAWYDRIALSAEQDSFTKLSDRVAIGRAANLAAPLPIPLVELFKSGPLADQQSALGMIAREFHPGYLRVLKMALESVEPVIRVQAAAVAARVRGPLNAQIPHLASRAADPTASSALAMETAADLRSAIDSGLLEAAELATATGVHSGLLGRIFAREDMRHRKAAAGERLSHEPASDDLDEAYAARLLRDGRFDDFRAMRLTERRPVRGRYRHRLLMTRPLGAALKRQLLPVTVRR